MQPLPTVHFVTNGSNGETLLRGTAVFILAIFLSLLLPLCLFSFLCLFYLQSTLQRKDSLHDRITQVGRDLNTVFSDSPARGRLK